ncbi:hypothetical protein [Novipirellula sp.]|uniref:hypothetical protein n=1 Tax=Novipirellula sp. TaxID=2795430 RepID=UPI0035699E7C
MKLSIFESEKEKGNVELSLSDKKASELAPRLQSVLIISQRATDPSERQIERATAVQASVSTAMPVSQSLELDHLKRLVLGTNHDNSTHTGIGSANQQGAGCNGYPGMNGYTVVNTRRLFRLGGLCLIP